MGFLNTLKIAAAVFLVIEALMFMGFHIFPKPIFISSAGLIVFFIFLIFEISFVTFK